MTKSEVLRHLRKILVNLYSTEASARLIAEDAGLIIASIKLGNTIEECWYEILKEADRHDKVKEVVQLACEDYAVRAAELYHTWQKYEKLKRLTIVGPMPISPSMKDSPSSSNITDIPFTKPSCWPRIKIAFNFAITIGTILLLLSLWPDPVLKITTLRAKLEQILRIPVTIPAYTLTATLTPSPMPPTPISTPTLFITETEPNDTSDKANGPLTTNRIYQGYHNNFSDYFKFITDSAGTITVNFTSNYTEGIRGQRIQLQLYYLSASVENRVGEAKTPPFTITHNGKQGLYYLRVFTDECCLDNLKSYQLTVSFPQATPTPQNTTTATPTLTATPISISNPLPTSTPTATSTVEGTSSYIVTDYYIPTGWMLNGENPAKFVFDDGYSGNCHSNTICYKISWQPERVTWIGLYWLHPKADAAGGNWPQPDQPGCNLSGATTVTFWARGETGGEVVEFESAFYAGQKVESGTLTLTSNWQEYSMNVSGADLSNIVGAFAWYMSRSANPAQTIFYLDDIRYQGIESGNVTCTQPTAATPTPKPTSQHGYNFESGMQNWITSEGGFKPITVTTTTKVVYSGIQALQLNPNLRGGDTDIYQHTETVAYFNNAIPEGFGASGPYDLTGKAVSCFVYLPSELAPSGNPQAYIQLFVKDKDFRNQFNTALDIVSSNVNKWLQLNLTVGQGGGMDNGFDSKQSNALGISIKLHNQATLNYAGPLYIDHCSIQQP